MGGQHRNKWDEAFVLQWRGSIIRILHANIFIQQFYAT